MVGNGIDPLFDSRALFSFLCFANNVLIVSEDTYLPILWCWSMVEPLLYVYDGKIQQFVCFSLSFIKNLSIFNSEILYRLKIFEDAKPWEHILTETINL